MKLLTENIWSFISKSSRNSDKAYVAVAYLGNGASEMLRLKSGDILVVDASESNVRSGVINPLELQKFVGSGVNVFSKENLHAKVFVFGTETYVGSTNVSNNSASNLVEAVVFSEEVGMAKSSIEFITSIATERLSPEYIKYLISIYNPPKRPRKRPEDIAESTLWVQKIYDYEYSEEESNAHDVGVVKFKSKASNKPDYEMDSIRYRVTETLAKNVKTGDLLIKVYEEHTYDPVRVLGVERATNKQSVVVIVEQLIDAPDYSSKDFLSYLVSLGHEKRFRAFTKPEQREKILNYFKRT
ncbi:MULTISPECIES: phospholipase D family protein [Vibrio]|uniref:phospholipase D family protein n=1 Tax=Vibrio TaxID=662 RepID=UPI00076A3283|nr:MULTISPECIES: phospholipase D family protein [Vibrio]